MIVNAVPYEPVTKPYQYVAHVKNGKVFAVMQNLPPADIQPGEFEITKSQFYFLRDMVLNHYTDMRTLRSMANSIQTKINKLGRG